MASVVMRRLITAGAVAAVGSDLFQCHALWTCAMPQVWGTGIPVTQEIPYFLAFDVLATVVVASIGTWLLVRITGRRTTNDRPYGGAGSDW